MILFMFKTISFKYIIILKKVLASIINNKNRTNRRRDHYETHIRIFTGPK